MGELGGCEDVAAVRDDPRDGILTIDSLGCGVQGGVQGREAAHLGDTSRNMAGPEGELGGLFEVDVRHEPG
ncbi:hypothetical protein [Methylobacterium sp. GXF4]|uniref:hypothetical protein n=1 Tax=Methylobacterium sp. GXF4 TaxID=1096546 RepID=UPI0013EF902B|nr:hypothetical protein [Methylobacterium sp. GXF4]